MTFLIGYKHLDAVLVRSMWTIWRLYKKQTLYQIIEDTCDKYNNMREGQIDDIIEAVEKCVAACAEEARKLIDESQPAKFF